MKTGFCRKEDASGSYIDGFFASFIAFKKNMQK
jgi:hypothetical protein